MASTMSIPWRLWCFSFEKNNTQLPTNVAGVTINTTTPLKDSRDGDFFMNKDGDDNLISYVWNNELPDDGIDWESAFGSCWFTFPSSITGTVWFNIFQDTPESLLQGDRLQIRGGGGTNFRINGQSIQNFTTTLVGGTDYRIAFKIAKKGRIFAVRLYNSSDTLLEEQSTQARASGSKIFIFGHRQKDTFTGTNPNAHLFMDNCIFFYTAQEVRASDIPWMDDDQEIHLGTVDITSQPAPAHDDYDQFPDTGEDKEDNVDDISPHDADSTYQQSAITAIEAAKVEQTYPVDPGPSLSGGDVINGVMLGLTSRGVSVDAVNENMFMNLYDGEDDEYEILSVAATFAFRSHGRRQGANNIPWTESSRNGMEVGSSCEMPAFDTDWDASTSQTVLPTGDGTDDNDWDESSGTDAWDLLDNEDVPTYISSSTVGQRQDLTFPTPTIPAGTVISGVTVRAKFINPGASETVTFRAFYKDSGGTRHYTPSGQLGFFALANLHQFWDKDPEDDTLWTAAKIGGAGGREFGVEIEDDNDGTAEVRCYSLFVHINLKSNIRETSYWIETVYGPAIKDPVLIDQSQNILPADKPIEVVAY